MYAEVVRIFEQFPTVGADIEIDRHGMERADPAPAVYSASLPMQIASPPWPWSPIPRIADESVATIMRTSSNG